MFLDFIALTNFLMLYIDSSVNRTIAGGLIRTGSSMKKEPQTTATEKKGLSVAFEARRGSRMYSL
jgi:hypothetical protein